MIDEAAATRELFAGSPGLGKGSAFEVKLPLVAAAGEKPSQKIKLARSSPSLPRIPRRVLVVDDNADAAEALSILLRLSGHDVSVAHDGPAALKIARQSKPEVILMDISMPGMNGYEAARELRQIPDLEKAIIVAVTGYGDEEVQRELQQAGFDGHLVKPASAAAIERVLGLRQPN